MLGPIDEWFKHWQVEAAQSSPRTNLTNPIKVMQALLEAPTCSTTKETIEFWSKILHDVLQHQRPYR